MCGIVGYVGERPALPVLLDGLRRLEYRGYDSAGVALRGDGEVVVAKRAGRVADLERAVAASAVAERVGTAGAGIGHTRWATHGEPSDRNAHPHADERLRVAVVHNGIIENHAQLRAELEARGHRFRSATDSEVVAHLVDEALDAAAAAPRRRAPAVRGVLRAAFVRAARGRPARLPRRVARTRAAAPSGPRGGARPAAAAGGDATGGGLLRAVLAAVGRLRGSFALAAVAAGEPGVLVAARREAPLVVGLGCGEQYLASDVTALLPYTREVLVLRDGEVAQLRPDGVRLFDFAGRPLPRRAPERVAWDAEAAERGGYPHFMIKEIHEQPQAVNECLRGRLGGGLRLRPALPELEASAAGAALGAARRVLLLGCGTAHHACLVGRHLLERWAGVAAETDLASEFRYRQPLVGPGSVAIAVSQSGETADTIAALREARRRGAPVLGVVNVVGSTVAREADAVLYTRAGPEVAVASTKAYTTQLAVLALVALWVASARGPGASPAADGAGAGGAEGAVAGGAGRAGRGPRQAGAAPGCAVGAPDGAAAEPGGRPDLRGLAAALAALPGRLQAALALEAQVAEVAARLARHEHCFFIGRGLDWAAAAEGQLKLKEVSYVHAEAHAAGELKHGTLALVGPGTPVVALLTQPHLAAKTAANVAEVRARGAWVVGVATPELAPAARAVCHELLVLPEVPADLAPLVAAVPLQLLAYHAAVARGADVDRPRNLAKSVTVE